MSNNSHDGNQAPAIVVDGLVKHFGDVVAVSGVDFTVPPGTVLGLLGPNGAGKTTIVRMLTTILRPDAGRATILGLDVTRRPHAVRSVIGLAGQYAAVDEALTGRENLRMMGRLTHQPKPNINLRADELLERFELTGAADRPVRTYSGGMRRRLDLAAALVHRPRVLFLDEPTTGLDPPGRLGLWALIGELVADGTTLLLTTQYLEEADRLSDHIIVIDGGRIVASGSAAQLKGRLGTTVVEVRFHDVASATTAGHRLAAIGAVKTLDDGRTVSVSVPDAGRAVLEVVRLLDTGGIDPESIMVREPTLDDVFLELTGHKAESRAPQRDDESKTAGRSGRSVRGAA
jgi:ABC-2 type transport system ATP-binding protein